MKKDHEEVVIQEMLIADETDDDDTLNEEIINYISSRHNLEKIKCMGCYKDYKKRIYDIEQSLHDGIGRNNIGPRDINVNSVENISGTRANSVNIIQLDIVQNGKLANKNLKSGRNWTLDNHIKTDYTKYEGHKIIKKLKRWEETFTCNECGKRFAYKD